MKNFLLVATVAGSMAASFIVGTSYTRARNDIRNNLCLTDKAIVSVLDQSLANVTREEAAKEPKRYEKARSQITNYVRQFEQAAPCTISVTIPPDVLKGG